VNGSSLRIEVPGREPGGYEVRIERGAMADLAGLTRLAAPAHRYAIRSALEAEGGGAQLFTFPAGEWNKTRQEWARLSDEMLAEGFGRDSAVVAVGGGVTGDLAGFVAATYMRGIPYVQVPTSLLAMLDSCVGGKTGLDTLEAKNPIGAFHQPSLVLVDPDLLGTLPIFQLASGLAEAVKAAAIADDAFFEWLESHVTMLLEREPDLLTELVRRSVAIKAEVVEEDPEESGRREILNFGHTIGHSLEALGGYGVLHGEAVACGMRIESRIGEILGVTDEGTSERLAALLAACELDRPVEEEFTAERILEAAQADKKARGSVLRCVLLGRIGGVSQAAAGGWAHELPPDGALELLRDALRSRTRGADSD
jgi:3-dehydroquinate synthase